MTPAPLRLATRGSPLALRQTEQVAELLCPLAAGGVEVVIIETTGDQFPDTPLNRIGSDGVFTREVQRAVLAGAADVAVHSLKDLPTEPVEGLALGAVPPRAPAGDVLVCRGSGGLDALPRSARVATGSLRRRAQLLHRRPDLIPADVRGNVETRLRKLDGGAFEALVLARAGLERLGLAARISEPLSTDWMLPAVGQGAIGLECREADQATCTLLARIDDVPSRSAVTAERAFLRILGGGCLVPVGALAEETPAGLLLRGAVLAPDGSARLDGRGVAKRDPAGLGRRVAEDLLRRGAAELLARCRTP